MPLTLYKTFAWQTLASLRLFTCLAYVNTYCVPNAHLRQNKPFPLLYLGRAQIINDVTRRGQKISVCYIIAKSDVHKAEMLVERSKANSNSNRTNSVKISHMGYMCTWNGQRFLLLGPVVRRSISA